MSQKAGTTIRIADDIAEVLPVRLAERRVKLTPLINDFLRSWVAHPGSLPTQQSTGPPADTAKLKRAAATARDLAAQLEGLIGGNAAPPTDTISMPTEALISILMEVIKNGQNAPAAEAVQAAVDRIAREFGAAGGAAAADSGGPATASRRK